MTTFKDHFSGHAGDYALYRPVYTVELARRLAALSPSRGLACDVGCGSGQLSALLGDVFEAVEAIDPSAQQIANAAPHPHVRYRVAPAEALPLGDASADLIVAAQAAHWFDLPRFYAEVRRIAKPGALLALVTYLNAQITPEVDAVVEHFYSAVVGPYWPPERRHVETGYRSLDFPFTELDAPELWLEADWDLAAYTNYVSTWSALKGAQKALGDAPWAEFKPRLAAAWGAPETRRRIRWPLPMRLARL